MKIIWASSAKLWMKLNPAESWRGRETRVKEKIYFQLPQLLCEELWMSLSFWETWWSHSLHGTWFSQWCNYSLLWMKFLIAALASCRQPQSVPATSTWVYKAQARWMVPLCLHTRLTDICCRRPHPNGRQYWIMYTWTFSPLDYRLQDGSSLHVV